MNRSAGEPAPNSVRARRLGLDTQYEAVVFMHKECQVCRSEGFNAHARVMLRHGALQVIATLYQVTGDLIAHNEAALSESAWRPVDLHVGVGDAVTSGQPLCTVHADSPGELAYAFEYAAANRDIIAIRES